jgi:exopolyphosphatase/guanosine-5'-triphosphate,3'-diphosphate pyrophosphatase
MLEPLDDRSELLGLGQAIDRRGRIEPDDRRLIVTTLGSYVDLARAAGASRITLIATEPLRRAANAKEVLASVRRATGLQLRVLSVREEAELTFLGVCGGSLPERETIVVDIGGGTTEVGLHVPGQPLTVLGMALGSARLTSTIVEHDPPTLDEMSRLGRAARDALADVPTQPRAKGRRSDVLPEATFVGGTATNLARLGPLTRAALAEDRRTLAEIPAAEVVRRYGMRPQRARQLAAGAAIVDALLEWFALDEALVSDASLRDGAVIAAARFGDAWPEHVAKLFGKPESAASRT